MGGWTGDIDDVAVSPTFPLKEIIPEVSERYQKLQGIVLSPATGYKRSSGTNSYEGRRKEDVNYRHYFPVTA